MKSVKLNSSLLTVVGALLIGCSAKTLQDDGGLAIARLNNGAAEIRLPTLTSQPDSLNLKELHQFTEVYEEGRGKIKIVGSRSILGPQNRTEEVKGTVSFYSGVTADGTKGSGVYLQGDAKVFLNSPRVKVYASPKAADEISSPDDFSDQCLAGELLGSQEPVIGLQVQDDSIEGIQSIGLVCVDEDKNEELCGVASLEKRRGLIGNTGWQGARGHNATGAFKIYRSPKSFDLITETAPNYKADQGPDLYWYLSTVDFELGVRDGRYANLDNGTSFITHEKRLEQNQQAGAQIITRPGTALTDLKNYKVANVWCEKFSVLFQYAELIELNGDEF